MRTPLRMTALVAVLAAIAPTVQAESAAKASGYCDAHRQAQNRIDDCYANAGDDNAALARCDALPNPVVRNQRVCPAPRRPAPDPRSPTQPTAGQIDLCYAWAGDDNTKLSACDQLSSAKRILLLLGPR